VVEVVATSAGTLELEVLAVVVMEVMALDPAAWEQLILVEEVVEMVV
jgi:hypothetical protein